MITAAMNGLFGEKPPHRLKLVAFKNAALPLPGDRRPALPGKAVKQPAKPPVAATKQTAGKKAKPPVAKLRPLPSPEGLALGVAVAVTRKIEQARLARLRAARLAIGRRGKELVKLKAYRGGLYHGLDIKGNILGVLQTTKTGFTKVR